MTANTILNTGTGGDTIATDDMSGVKAQRVKIITGATGTDGGNVSLSNPFPVGTAGSLFTASTSNSSTTQLAASATFTGTVETVYNQQSISILLTSDQPGTLTCLQYIDAGGTRLAHTDTFTNTAGSPISRAIVANGNYFKVTYQNTGGSTTTTFQLDVAYGQIVPITNLGNQPFALAEYNNAAVSNANPIPIQPVNTTRTYLSYYANGVASGTTGTETAIAISRTTMDGTAAGTAANSQTPTSGKRFRITTITFGSRGNASGTAQVTNFSLRINSAGAVTTTSSVALSAGTATPGTAQAWDRWFIDFGSDGPEIVGNGTLQWGVTANATYATNAPTWYVTITGYEY
jgi:hypothetical protein